MAEQREKPLPPGGLAWLATMKAKHGGAYSGGEVEGFRKGWAVPLGLFKAHYMEAGATLMWSTCGLWWTRGQVFGAGSMPKCKTCWKRAPHEEIRDRG